MSKVKKVLDKLDVAEAALNDPNFNRDEVVLGDQTFKIMHLEYDDYIQFVAYLEPFFNVLLSNTGLSKTEANLDFKSLITLCKNDLPEMGRLVLKQSKPDITIEEVKSLCKTPFKICDLVFLQYHKNETVKEFQSFFPQLVTILQG